MREKILLSIIVFLGLAASAQQYRTVPHDQFKRGEKLDFRISFYSLLTGNIPAATATLVLTNENKQINGRNTFHAVVTGKTKGFIEYFYTVEERFESYFDDLALIPHLFIRNTHENSYVKYDKVTFRHKDKLAVSNTSVKKVPVNVQDMVSAFYYSRSFDLTNAKPGKEFELPFFLDDTVYNSKIKFTGREKIKTRLGKFNCIVFKPMVATGQVFDDPYPVTIWITDDKNRIPVLIETELTVGSARIELTSYQNLANPVTSLVK